MSETKRRGSPNRGGGGGGGAPWSAKHESVVKTIQKVAPCG